MSKTKTVVWPQLVLFGDSITQFSFQSNGWGSEIANKLARKCDVVNRGLSGYNSRWAKILLPRLFPSQTSENTVAVTVFFGANDCALEDKNSQQHVPLKEYSENLKEIAGHLASVGVSSDRVIFISPPPLHEATWEKECLLKGCPLNRHNSVAGRYAQACVEAAGQCGVEALDLWTLMQEDGQDYTVYLSDGLHLSDKGNQFVTQRLWSMLECRLENLPFILPYWGDVDAQDPESSLLCN
ncbi:hypothetical protein NHX12_019755 [Muraenolepis orangiensis]|uniref:Isoamyl acetate-hydrolyzing esterase 1 homolog n=1 Tax=Muraenolepis orangiensis TaxID=630683 RepID=A0A9Q0EU61_9TELE|nr:hypothetical protein NHX12_019755 [Muraenolepis orangiensis]